MEPPSRGKVFILVYKLSSVVIFWRIGKGGRVHIWRGPWIPSTLDRNVEELINPHAEQFDEDLVCSIFHPVDANRILLAWNTKTWMFSVKSAYHVKWKRPFGNLSGPSG